MSLDKSLKVKNKLKYHLIVLGCQMNISDSERVKAIIEAMGLEYTPNEDDANLLGIISCSVRQKPIDKVYSRIHKWNKQKNNRNIITFVTGCVLPDDKKKFLKLFDLVFSMSELNELPNMLTQYGISTPFHLNKFNDKEQVAESNAISVNETETTAKLTIKPAISIANTTGKSALSVKNIPNKKQQQQGDIFRLWKVQPHYQSDFDAYVPIQNGCNKFCTYCAVPYTRGREISRPSADIIHEVKLLMENDYKTITLLGQNVNSYGLDNKDEITFAQLLEEIGKIGDKLQKKCWIYFTAPHPLDMTRDVVEAMSKYKVLGKQIHLPLQSGSNSMLKRMNRKHDIDKYRESIKYIRELIPQATLFTDIIVGFTGETEEEFQATVTSFKEFKYNMAYIAMYSPRPGARSYKWADDIPNATKKARYQELTNCLESISIKYNQALIGKEMDVLVRTVERKTGYLSGHNEGKLIIRIKHKDKSLIGKMVKVKITDATGFSLTSELVEE